MEGKEESEEEGNGNLFVDWPRPENGTRAM
jgi:hypothetical protein